VLHENNAENADTSARYAMIAIVLGESAPRVHLYGLGCGTRSQTTVQTAIGRLRRPEQKKNKKLRRQTAVSRMSLYFMHDLPRSFNLEAIVRRPRDPPAAGETDARTRQQKLICMHGMQVQSYRMNLLNRRLTWKFHFSHEYIFRSRVSGFCKSDKIDRRQIVTHSPKL